MGTLYSPVVVYDSAQSSYWEDQLWIADTQLVPIPADQLRGSNMTIRWSRTQPTGLDDDYAQWSMNFAVQAAGVGNMSRLDDADAAVVENKMYTSWFTVNAHSISNDWQAVDCIWRHFGADQPKSDKPPYGHKLSPPWRLQTLGWTGTDSTPRMPDQVALTTTFRTAARKHWGRFYQGGFGAGQLAEANQGQALSGTCDELAGGMDSFLTDLGDDARIINAWIWSPVYGGALSITEISVDSVFDVIRSRRAKQVRYRKIISS